LVREYARTGRISLLDRLSGAVATEEVLATVPGLGPTLARRVHDTLGVETLEELECACYDGRLSGLRGFGVRRIAAISASLSAMLGGEARRFDRSGGPRSRPSVAAVLSVDHEYRRRARSGDLVRIAPRRFNPDGRAWLAILHTEREGWAFTALYSNTARAHRLDKTDDWVVLHADRSGQHDQCTVVTGRRGGTTRRIIRGRELECEAHHREPASSDGLGSVAGRVRCPSPRLPTETGMPRAPSPLEEIG
jgi:hypothetical protein